MITRFGNSRAFLARMTDRGGLSASPWHRYIRGCAIRSPAELNGRKGSLDVEVTAVDSPGDSRGPAGLRGNDPDTRRGGGDGTSYRGRLNIIAKSGDARG